MTKRKQLSMKRLTQMACDYLNLILDDKAVIVAKVRRDRKAIQGYLDYVWKNKNR